MNKICKLSKLVTYHTRFPLTFVPVFKYDKFIYDIYLKIVYKHNLLLVVFSVKTEAQKRNVQVGRLHKKK